MELREMIKTAEEKTGTVRALAEQIGISDSNLTAAKAGRRGLPTTACGKLAEIIGIDRWAVVAASDLVTEKNPERRAYLRPFVNSIAGIAMPQLASTEASHNNWRWGGNSRQTPPTQCILTCKCCLEHSRKDA